MAEHLRFEMRETQSEAKRKKLLGFFVGQVMKLSKGQANPQMVNDLLAKKLI